ncbi:MOSC domain-containing protein YiiM [Saccharopolyspora antimicrobica]|uniref:MOSC domain-containing protein YiiM n=1 Tax=Saccharopolyspora antimicrobica TaxID=455193 RepID=A0A1I4YSP2_9PSEU|nr:MOSC domain-containing protein [Saccharopolyspora antimicrobica]RKT82804.1 MOSC domain-containing protein YiiM [Saccharopolyspora antimicrobica]SFN41058.1 MOSC domain-containing protein YiiM [Saccharopolyspora antimicrobica]
MGIVQSVNVAVVRTGEWTGRVGRSGIDKQPVDRPVLFEPTGVCGDTVCDRKHHGAWYQAAYAFDREELAHWSRVLGRELVPGNAGENLTLTGVDSSSAVIGERWRIGGAVLRVTGPRTPCRVFAGFWDAQSLVKEFTEHGRTGAYLAVEEAGEITAGDTVEVLSRPQHGVRVAEVFAVSMNRGAELVDHVARGLDDLPEGWRESLAAKVARARSGTR